MQERMLKHTLISLFVVAFIGIGVASAQNTARYDQPDIIYRDALELYSKAKYSSARKQFRRAIEQSKSNDEYIRSEAYFYIAACGVKLYNKNADVDIKAFIDEFSTSNRITEARMLLADYLYYYKKYEEAIVEYEQIDLNDLADAQRINYLFHYGYSAFNAKRYNEAKSALSPLTEEETSFRVVAIYYYAYILYTEGKYQSALNEFEKIESDPSFAGLVPYYMLQIYYMQGKYKEVLEMGEELLSKASPKRAPEVARLMGEAHYRQGKYQQALPLLNLYYERSSRNPDQEGAYMLGYSYYKEAKYDTAVNYFLRAVSLNPNNELAQSALYHLGYCYAKEGKKKFAMDAFRDASRIDSNSFLKEDAMYQYAKISYDLGIASYKESLSVFEQFLKDYPKSAYAKKTYEYMLKAYTRSRNYSEALASLEKIEPHTPELQVAKQTLFFNQGVEYYNTHRFREASAAFDSSLSVNFDEILTAKATFWRGECAYKLGDVALALGYYSKFNTHPEVGSCSEKALGRYNQAYLLMENVQYEESLKHFKEFIRLAANADTAYLLDAILRAGDCEFMLRRFENAQTYYSQIIKKGIEPLDYAYYKNALCSGAMGKHKEKIDNLLRLTESYPRTLYMPMVLNELAATYLVMENNSKALLYYKQVRDNYSNQSLSRMAMLKIGLIHFNIGESQQALESFQRVVAEYPNSVEAKKALVSIRNIYMVMNKIDEFFAYAKNIPQAQMEETEKDSLTYMAAENQYMKGDCNAAMNGFKSYIQGYSNGYFITPAWFYYAECAFKNGLDSVAREAYSKVVKFPSGEFTEKAVRMAAGLYYSGGKYDQALELYKKMLVLQIPGTENEALLGRLRCFYKLGQTKNTLEAGLSVLKKDGLTQVEEDEARVYVARMSVKIGDESLARQSYNELLKAVNLNIQAEARYYMIEKRVAHGEFSTAEKLIFEYISNAPEDDYYLAKVYILWANIYEGRGNILQAKQTLQSVIDNYDGDDEIPRMAREKIEAIQAAEQAEREIEEKERAERYPEENEIIIPEM